MPRLDIHKDGVGTQFGKGQDPTKGGRKKKIYTVLKEKGYGKDDVQACFKEMAFYSIEELKAVAETKNLPAIMKVIAMAYKNAILKGDWKYIRDIMEHTIGKPKQEIENSGSVDVNYNDVSTEELERRLAAKVKLRALDDIE